MSALPQYHVVKEALVEDIERGDYAPGQRFLTEREICARFGVSRTTAVRALNDLVHAGLVTRHPGRGTFVAKPPHGSAAGAGRRQIGIVCQGLHGSNTLDIMRGVSGVCREADYDILLFESEWSADVEARGLRRARKAGVAGLVVYPVDGYANIAHFEALRRDQVPVVMVDRYYPMLQSDAVVPDNVMLGSDMVGHLARQGHRRIALVGSEEYLSTSTHERFAGFRAGLETRGIAFEPELAAPRPYPTLPDDERRALLSAWLALPTPPTAILALNTTGLDRVARDLLESGRGLDEVALACMDDMAPDTLLARTAVVGRIPSYDMGREAARLLLERIRGIADGPARHVVLPVEVTTTATPYADIRKAAAR